MAAVTWSSDVLPAVPELPGSPVANGSRHLVLSLHILLTVDFFYTLKIDGIVLLPENPRAYFELSAQAWILYKAPQ